jgi:P4 family phage/plasmid primase-like protien
MENKENLKVSNTQCNFKDIKQVIEFANMTMYDQAMFIADQLRDDLKIICPLEGNTLYYFYNEKSKLWKVLNGKSFFAEMAGYFNMTAKLIRIKLKKRNKLDDEDDDDDEDESPKKKILKLLNKFDTENYILEITKRFVEKLKDNEFVTKLNSIPHLFPLKDGKKINFKTLEVSDRTKEDFFSFETNLDYIPEENEKVEKYFSQLQPNKEYREYLRKVLGYIITGETCAQVFFVFYGDGENGKSLLMTTILREILKEFYLTMNKSIMVNSSSNDPTKPSPEKLALMGKRAGVHSEGKTADEIEMNDEMIKAISGCDPIECRGLFKDPVVFVAFLKLCMLTNYIPPLDADKAMKRRIRYVFMDSQFSYSPKEGQFLRDDDFKDDLLKNYLSHLFSWMAKGAFEFYKNRKIDMPEEYNTRTEHLMQLDDSIENFIKKRLTFTNNPKDFIKRSDLFNRYKKFCEENSQRCKQRSTLFSRFVNLKLHATLNGYDGFRGVSFIDEEQMVKEEDETSMFVKTNDVNAKEDKAVYVRAEDYKRMENQIKEISSERDLWKKRYDEIYEKVMEKKPRKKPVVKPTNMLDDLISKTENL